MDAREMDSEQAAVQDHLRLFATFSAFASGVTGGAPAPHIQGAGELLIGMVREYIGADKPRIVISALGARGCTYHVENWRGELVLPPTLIGWQDLMRRVAQLQGDLGIELLVQPIPSAEEPARKRELGGPGGVFEQARTPEEARALGGPAEELELERAVGVGAKAGPVRASPRRKGGKEKATEQAV